MKVGSWDKIRGKIKHAHDEIESAYEKHMVSAVDIVKERPLLNAAVKMSLSAIPMIGPNLRDLYDNIRGGTESGEEDKTKRILEFLEKLEQQNKEEFDRIAEDLKSNRQAIINAINQNKIEIAALITNSWEEIVDALHGLQKTADVTLGKVEAIAGGVERIQQSILGHRPSRYIEYKHPAKPSTFRGESTKIFVGRKQDIDTIRKYFAESNLPVSITGEGGIGKSELAYKAMHECEDMFDLIVPVYFESILTFDSFLLEIAKSLNLPIDEFEKKGLEERRQLIIDTLGQGEFRHPLIFADNYESVARVLTIDDSSVATSTKEEEEEKYNARKINAFLENLPPNTAVLLTSRERCNLDSERAIELDGLSETEGSDLFIKLWKFHFPKRGKPSAEIRKALKKISKKTGGHPLSIELLARSYRGEGLSKIREMLEYMGARVNNPKEESQRLRSLESCFNYSFNRLPQTHKDLLPKLIIFNSPFPADAVKEIFNFQGSPEILLDLYDHSLLRRIECDEYTNGDGDGAYATYHLYYFHPATKNYLESKVGEGAKREQLQNKYDPRFSLYYGKLVVELYEAIGTKDHVLSIELFNIIWQGKDNDFDKAIRVAENKVVASGISSLLGLILHTLGRYNAAVKYHKKSLAIHEELKDKLGMAGDHTNIGSMFYQQVTMQKHYNILIRH
jgi:NB-ARC domain